MLNPRDVSSGWSNNRHGFSVRSSGASPDVQALVRRAAPQVPQQLLSPHQSQGVRSPGATGTAGREGSVPLAAPPGCKPLLPVFSSTAGPGAAFGLGGLYPGSSGSRPGGALFLAFPGGALAPEASPPAGFFAVGRLHWPAAGLADSAGVSPSAFATAFSAGAGALPACGGP